MQWQQTCLIAIAEPHPILCVCTQDAVRNRKSAKEFRKTDTQQSSKCPVVYQKGHLVKQLAFEKIPKRSDDRFGIKPPAYTPTALPRPALSSRHHHRRTTLTCAVQMKHTAPLPRHILPSSPTRETRTLALSSPYPLPAKHVPSPYPSAILTASLDNFRPQVSSRKSWL